MLLIGRDSCKNTHIVFLLALGKEEKANTQAEIIYITHFDSLKVY